MRSSSLLGPSMPVAGIGALLGGGAHPADQAYGAPAPLPSGGPAGNRATVATATRGEQGTQEPDVWPPQRLAALREREMLASLAALDVREHHWLGHQDGTLTEV